MPRDSDKPRGDDEEDLLPCGHPYGVKLNS